MCGTELRTSIFLFLFFTIMSFNSTSACLHLHVRGLATSVEGAGLVLPFKLVIASE